MMRAGPATTPTGVFQTTAIVHIAYTAAIPSYFVVGEIMKSMVFPPEPGLVNFSSSTIWVFRGLFALFSGIQLVLVNTLYVDRAFVRRFLKRKLDVTDGTIAAALQSSQILRLAHVQAIAIFGLVLFIFNGHRYDLYGFGLVALLALLAIRPNRDNWTSIFREMSNEYPDVSPTPFLHR